MPTGYATLVRDGNITTLKEFALVCARAFGATVMFRDLPLEDDILGRIYDREQDENFQYYTRQLAKATAREQELISLTPEELLTATTRVNDARLQAHHDAIDELLQARSRYEAMLAEAQQWVPPTPDHVELRKFMIDQLTQSLVTDCRDELLTPPETLTPESYLEEELRRLSWTIRHYTQERTASENRWETTREWLDALAKSFSGAEESPQQ